MCSDWYPCRRVCSSCGCSPVDTSFITHYPPREQIRPHQSSPPRFPAVGGFKQSCSGSMIRTTAAPLTSASSESWPRRSTTPRRCFRETSPRRSLTSTRELGSLLVPVPCSLHAHIFLGVSTRCARARGGEFPVRSYSALLCRFKHPLLHLIPARSLLLLFATRAKLRSGWRRQC